MPGGRPRRAAATVPVIALMVVKGATWSNLNLFWLDLAWAPVTVCFARLFAAVFERPFQRHRGWVPLRQAMSARLCQLRRTAPAVLAGRWRDAGRVPAGH